MKKIFLFLITTITFYSCVVEEDNQPTCSHYLDYYTVGKGYVTPDNLIEGNYILTTPTQWETFLAELDPNAMSFINNTNIDFENKQLLVIVGQEAQHTGCEVSISSIVRYYNNIKVWYSNYCGTIGYTQNIRPFHIVAIDKLTLPIEFYSN
ncbi:MAG: hypothetical protein Q4B43_03070 [Bacteroidota bacterium]|nr:hypothetical protein [Bacteroidota bacterium]